jgi:hypothetical protein
MNEVLVNFPELRRLFGAYLNRDWPATYRTTDAAIDAYVAESGVDLVDTARVESATLLATEDVGLAAHLDDMGLEYLLRNDDDARAFVERMHARLVQALGKR